jgi:NAD(P)-dependent dehydrogenase (short-subunit alcohol dehydrogenase family)
MPRLVVVSGGGTGIGRATAARFTAGGDTVVLIGRRADVLNAAAMDLGATAVTADLTEPAEVALARDAILTLGPSVDVVVHAAGGNAAFREESIVDGGDELERVRAAWEANLRLNTLTTVLLTEALKPHLTRPGGRLLLLSSIAAYRGSGSGSYGGSKAALHPYAYDLAAELGPDGITVNVVAPGFIADTEFFQGQLADERRATLVGQTLNRRAGAPDDVAETLHWLASPAAGHVTAQIVQVNGGAERGR